MSSALILRLSKIMAQTAIFCGSCSLLCQNLPEKSGAPSSVAPPYTPHMAFDVVSIRESGEGHSSYIDNPPQAGFYHAERVMAAGFVLHAYDLKMFQLLKNLPEWALTTKFTVSAKADAATDEAIAKLSDKDAYAEKRHMLQLMLADRFHLQIHPETRISTTYELLTTEHTAKFMTPVQGDIAKTVSTCNHHFSKQGIEVDSKGCPFSILLSGIRQELGTEILDRTGMTGAYAYHLMWSSSSRSLEDGDSYPHMVDAVREQLGLELRQTKGPVTFWIVDHIERPTPN